MKRVIKAASEQEQIIRKGMYFTAEDKDALKEMIYKVVLDAVSSTGDSKIYLGTPKFHTEGNSDACSAVFTAPLFTLGEKGNSKLPDERYQDKIESYILKHVTLPKVPASEGVENYGMYVDFLYDEYANNEPRITVVIMRKQF